MKAVMLLSARSTSKRLPNKHFLNLWKGLTPLNVLCRRLSRTGIPICIVTTTNKSDEVFDNLKGEGVSVFKGSIDNIPYRQYMAAKNLGAEWIISIDGDDILTSPEGVRTLFDTIKNDPAAEDKLFYTVGLPLGMNASAYSVSLLGKKIRGKEQLQFETGWGRVFGDVVKVEVSQKTLPFPDKKLRFTLDYEQDFNFFQNIVSHFETSIETVSTDNILRYVLNNKIFDINESIIEEYWKNFYREKELEENASK
ncbi:MAG: hypothetical protein K2P81_16305 [Bacteriovoracaceae bacterium]|nr:hypothetical protein [Bacteriovoracaceae bacterium]